MKVFVVDDPRPGALRALNYSPIVERIRKAGSTSSRPLRDIVTTFGRAYGTVFTRIDCEPEHGVELLSQSDMFAAEPRGRVIRRDSMPRPDDHLIKRRQVLLAGAGTLGETELYGRALLADNRLVGKHVGPDCLTIEFAEPEHDQALFAYAWLASPTGLQAIRSTSYGTKILRFRSELLSTLPVPRVAPEMAKAVADRVREAARLREVFLTDLQQARSLVERQPEVLEATAMCAVRRRRSILWGGPFPTLSAWTFASTAGALGPLQSKWKTRLRDLVEPDGVFRGGRGARIPCKPPHGIAFLSQRDAFLVRPIPQRVLLPSGDLVPREGTIMVGGQGTLGEGELFGRATLVTEGGAHSAWTEHLLRIVPKPGAEPPLFAYLTTMLGFRLLRSTAVGTKLLSMRPDLVLDLPVPTLQEKDNRRVAQLVTSSLRARAQADVAEAEAIRLVEEEVLPQWLG